MKEILLRGRSPATGQGLAVAVKAGRIRAVDSAPAEKDAPFLARGLVDLQINGYGGIDFNGAPPAPEAVLEICRRLAALGVTRFLPTVVTGSREAMAASIQAIAQARRRHPLIQAMVAGLHVEGPSISPEDGPRGAHPKAHVRPPDLAEFRHWREISEGLLRIATLAPEHEGALEYIAALAAEGVIVALGHSAASPERIRAAVEAGARMSTHLGNGVAAHLPRHPNLLWAQLAEDRLTASFIPDGAHLSAEVFRAMLRAKGSGRAVLVSDMAALAGGTPGVYRQPIGGDVELTADGRILLSGTPYLAGSATPLSVGVPRAAAMAGIPLAEALALASEAPARLLGLGGLEPGAEADLILFRAPPEAAPLEILETWIGGERAA